MFENPVVLGGLVVLGILVVVGVATQGDVWNAKDKS